jgi:tetratricopeptide (TPR) repeat protein
MAVLLLVAIGLVAFVFINKDDLISDDSKPKTTSEVIADSATTQYSQGKDAAVKMTSEAFENSENSEDKFALAEQTGAVYESSQDYDKAIEWYMKADEIKPNQRGPLGGLARSYKAKGDKTKAIEYFEKVLKYVDFSGRQGTQNDKAYYEYELAQLKKGQ